MTVGVEDLRRVMRRWTSGVTIVTASAGGRRHGMTVSSFTSISLDPPLVLVSLANSTLTGDLVRQSQAFGVTILAEGQEEASETFAGRVPESGDRFAGLETETLVTGAPFLRGGLAWLDCRLEQALPAGTTTLYIGRVVALRSRPGKGRPLVYFDRAYQDLC